MTEFRLYMAQRLSALVMAPFVLVHIGVMIYAIQGGLTAWEILGRTQGSVLVCLLRPVRRRGFDSCGIGLRVILGMGRACAAARVTGFSAHRRWAVRDGRATPSGR